MTTYLARCIRKTVLVSAVLQIYAHTGAKFENLENKGFFLDTLTGYRISQNYIIHFCFLWLFVNTSGSISSPARPPFYRLRVCHFLFTCFLSSVNVWLALTDLTCHRGRDAAEEDSGSSVIWLYLAIASSWPSPNALSDGLSMSRLLRAQTHTCMRCAQTQEANPVNSHLHFGPSVVPLCSQQRLNLITPQQNTFHCLSLSLSFSPPPLFLLSAFQSYQW